MPLLELQSVTKSYDSLNVVDNFDFSVEPGELRCLLGPNGAGKTTSIDLITGRQKMTRRGGSSSTVKILRTGASISVRAPELVESFKFPPCSRICPFWRTSKSPRRGRQIPSATWQGLPIASTARRFEEVIEMVGLETDWPTGPAICPMAKPSGWKSAWFFVKARGCF